MTVCLSELLWTGTTFPTFQSDGRVLVSKDCSKILDKIIEEYSLVFFRNLEFILSMPAAEESLRVSIILATPHGSIKACSKIDDYELRGSVRAGSLKMI